ncbi:MAG: sigma-54 interaction domain-containing protein, partial [Planctomycetota bacterium]
MGSISMGIDSKQENPMESARSVGIIAKSQAMAETLETLHIVAKSRCNPVLIAGETGTGKELAARVVHHWRHGSDAPYVAVNCAALTANLLESELFGHVKGSFTGADRNKTGLFELAGEGTIFLDEISEMPMDLQAKLLRVLQENTFRQVGGTKDIHCAATIIASSNRDLLASVKQHEFRQDLYYRLAVFPVELPPLRDPSRRNDILPLAQHFLKRSRISDRDDLQGFTDEARNALSNHNWPGNVRELKNVVERAILLEPSNRITLRSLRITRAPAGLVGRHRVPAEPATPEAPPTPAEAIRNSQPTSPEDFSLETAEREFIIRALQETGWQRTRAAALLGITRATLHSKLKRYDIHPPDKKPVPDDNP